MGTVLFLIYVAIGSVIGLAVASLFNRHRGWRQRQVDDKRLGKLDHLLSKLDDDRDIMRACSTRLETLSESARG